jgi:hypothetical protein
MNTESKTEAAIPSDRPVMFVTSETESRLIIRKIVVRVIVILFGSHDKFGAALRTDIDLAFQAGKAVATGTVEVVPFKGIPAVVTKYDWDQMFQSYLLLLYLSSCTASCHFR